MPARHRTTCQGTILRRVNTTLLELHLPTGEIKFVRQIIRIEYECQECFDAWTDTDRYNDKD